MVVKDRSKLSTEPENIRKRLRRGAQKQSAEVELLANHKKPIEDWDLEELARGRPRDKNGTFTGRRPMWITVAVLAEAKRRLAIRSMEHLSIHLSDAIKVVYDIMMSTGTDEEGHPIVDAKTRLVAAQYIIDHVIGKPKTRVDIDTGDNLRAFLAGALVMPDGSGGYRPAHPVIELGTEAITEIDDDE